MGWVGRRRKEPGQAPGLERGLRPEESGLGVTAGGSGGLRREDRETGESGDEFSRVFVPGCAEDLGGWAALDDFAGVQDGDAVAEGSDR